MFFNRPPATGSATLTNTIGIVRVRCNTAWATGKELATMTSGLRPTNSSARVRIRSRSSAEYRSSSCTLRPSIQPSFASCSPQGALLGPNDTLNYVATPQYPDPPYPLVQLSAHLQRPRGRHAADK